MSTQETRIQQFGRALRAEFSVSEFNVNSRIDPNSSQIHVMKRGEYYWTNPTENQEVKPIRTFAKDMNA